jgi:(p)ppGpp synthase/HD superfamily hydrolase
MRKGSQIPYLSHLMSVSALVLEYGGSEVAAIAGLLHDAVEDAPQGQGPAVLTDIGRAFGPDVAAIVRACSDGLDEAGNRSGTWAQRKTSYVETLPSKSGDALLVTAAGKTHNAGCIAADVRAYGSAFWSVFNACPHQLAWYYAAVEAVVGDNLANQAAVRALSAAVHDLIEVAGVPRPVASAEPPACECN